MVCKIILKNGQGYNIIKIQVQKYQRKIKRIVCLVRVHDINMIEIKLWVREGLKYSLFQ